MAENRIDDLRRRLERDPGSRLFAQLAEELRRAGAVEDAISVARAGLERHPAYPSARLTLGRALLDAGDAEAARGELESALQGAPDNILASRLLGEALESLGDLRGALTRYRATLDMAPGDAQVKGRVQALESRQGLRGGEPAAPTESAAGAEHAGKLPPTVRIRVPSGEARPGRAPLPPTTGEAGGPKRAGRAGAEEGVASGGTEATGAGVAEGEAALPPTLPLGARTSEFDPRTAGVDRLEVPAGAGTVGSGTGDAVQPSPEVVEGGEGGPAGAPGRPLSSATLAELYFKQGLLDRAVEVYRQVVEEEPDNENARRRLREIGADMQRSRGEGLAAGSGANREARRRALERTIETLEALLAVVSVGR